MDVTFECTCGSAVATDGNWALSHSADPVDACPGCGRDVVVTPAAADDGAHRSPESDDDDRETAAVPGADAGPSEPLAVGDEAPDFELPGVGEDGRELFRLSDYTDTGPVLLAFYPFDFSPVCTEQLCRFRDIAWLRVREDTDVFAVSVDSVYSHRAFREEHEFNFPLLTDRLASVAGAFGVRDDECENHPAVSQRAMFGIDTDGTIGYRWLTDDAWEAPDFDDIEAAIDWAD